MQEISPHPIIGNPVLIFIIDSKSSHFASQVGNKVEEDMLEVGIQLK